MSTTQSSDQLSMFVTNGEGGNQPSSNIPNSKYLRLTVHSAIASDAIVVLRALADHCAEMHRFISSSAPLTELASMKKFSDAGHPSPEANTYHRFFNKISDIFAHLMNGAPTQVLSQEARKIFCARIEQSLSLFGTCGDCLLDASRGIDIHPRTIELKPPGAPLDYKISVLKQAHLLHGLSLINIGCELLQNYLSKAIAPTLKQHCSRALKDPSATQNIANAIQQYLKSTEYREFQQYAHDPQYVADAIKRARADANGSDAIVTTARPDLQLIMQLVTDLHKDSFNIFQACQKADPSIGGIGKAIAKCLSDSAIHLIGQMARFPLLEKVSDRPSRDDMQVAAMRPSDTNFINLPLRQALLLNIYVALNCAIPVIEALTDEEHKQAEAKKVKATAAPLSTNEPKETPPKNSTPSISSHISPPPRNTPVYSRDRNRGNPLKDQRILRRLSELKSSRNVQANEAQQASSLDDAIKMELNDHVLFVSLFPDGTAKGQFNDINEWKEYTSFVASSLLDMEKDKITNETKHQLFRIHPHLIHKHRKAGELPSDVNALCKQLERLRKELKGFHSFYDPNDITSSTKVNAAVLPRYPHPLIDPLKHPEYFQSSRTIKGLKSKIIHPTDKHYKTLVMLGVDPVPVIFAAAQLTEAILNGHSHKTASSIHDTIVSHVSAELTRLRIPSEEELFNYSYKALKQYHTQNNTSPHPTEDELVNEARTYAKTQEKKHDEIRRKIEGTANLMAIRCAAVYSVDRKAKRVLLRDAPEASAKVQENDIIKAIYSIIKVKLAAHSAEN